MVACKRFKPNVSLTLICVGAVLLTLLLSVASLIRDLFYTYSRDQIVIKDPSYCTRAFPGGTWNGWYEPCFDAYLGWRDSLSQAYPYDSAQKVRGHPLL